MTYTKSSTYSGTADGSALLNIITTQLAASGWTNAAGTYSSTSGGTTLSITPPVAFGTNGKMLFTSPDFSGASFYLISGNTTFSGSYMEVELSISPDHFYLKIMGPSQALTGANDVTYGSPSSFVLLTKYTPYSASNSNAANHKVMLASFSSDPGTWTSASAGTAAFSSSGRAINQDAAQETIELATMRPAIQDQPAVGDLAPSKKFLGGDILWPYVIIGGTSGLIGRVNNCFFAGDNYLAGSGDQSGQLANKTELVVNGLRYARTLPCYYPSASGTIGFSPLGVNAIATTTAQGTNSGTPGISNGGPNIYIKKGTGV
jgi:hypothetical protein